jgi:signal transduction histidine kinase
MIRSLIEECVAVLQFKAEEKRIELQINYPKTLPMKLQTDSNRVKQILINLLSNAIKYT